MVQARANGGWMADDYQMRNYREENQARTAIYWGMYYKYIFYANQILDLIPPDFDPSQTTDVNKLIMKYKAAALTMRALSYTYLMWLYQDDYLHGGNTKAGVPLYTTVGGEEDRAPAQEVWNQIMADATEAVDLFKKSGLSNSTSKTDIDASVASVVLGALRFTIGDWPKAIAAADYVMTEYPTLINETDYTTKGMSNIALPRNHFWLRLFVCYRKRQQFFPRLGEHQGRWWIWR